MKVSNKSASQLASSIQKKETTFKKSTDGAAKSGVAGLSAAPSPEVVSLSNKAQQIRKATEIAKNDTVDEKKIAKFQNLIDAGKYTMDSAKIADRLVDEHLKMPT